MTVRESLDNAGFSVVEYTAGGVPLVAVSFTVNGLDLLDYAQRFGLDKRKAKSLRTYFTHSRYGAMGAILGVAPRPKFIDDQRVRDGESEHAAVFEQASLPNLAPFECLTM